MIEDWLLLSFFILIGVAAIDIIRRAFMAVLDLERQQSIARKMRKLRKSNQPGVTVLVYSRGNVNRVVETVDALKKNHYSAYDVSIVGTSPDSAQAKDIRRYVRKMHRKMYVTFLQRRVSGTRASHYKAAYAKSKKGEIVICLEDGICVDRNYIKRAVASRGNAERWNASLENEAIQEAGIVGITQTLRNLFKFRTHMALTVMTSQKFRDSNKITNQTHVEAIPYVELFFLALLIVGVSFGGLIALFYIWVLFTSYLLALVWMYRTDEISERIKLSFSVFSALFFMPVARVIQGFSQLSKRK